MQFSGTLFPVNFFNISTLPKGGGARPSAPRRGAPGDAPAEKTCFLLIKNLYGKKKNQTQKISKKGPKFWTKFWSLFWIFLGLGFFFAIRFFISKKHVFSAGASPGAPLWGALGRAPPPFSRVEILKKF